MDSNQKSLVKPGEIFKKQKWNNPSGKDFGTVTCGPSTALFYAKPRTQNDLVRPTTPRRDIGNRVKSRLKSVTPEFRPHVT